MNWTPSGSGVDPTCSAGVILASTANVPSDAAGPAAATVARLTGAIPGSAIDRKIDVVPAEAATRSNGVESIGAAPSVRTFNAGEQKALSQPQQSVQASSDAAAPDLTSPPAAPPMSAWRRSSYSRCSRASSSSSSNGKLAND